MKWNLGLGQILSVLAVLLAIIDSLTKAGLLSEAATIKLLVASNILSAIIKPLAELHKTNDSERGESNQQFAGFDQPNNEEGDD